ncbi:probable protein phosphatase DDB_G0279461 [Schistocerca gregaria]|uniref:probable protein phosphatase DDB_G0279461 n=1 Tax=Schistocerca gregaria TaxID=7010 RepID=UPI00211E8DBC|nr:probable protein phosphatase DDB_G0279461 [Schistocerca gregaria]
MFYEATPLSEKKTLKPSAKKHRYSALTVKDASKLIESLNAHKVTAESSHTSHLTERVSESSEEKKEEFRILLSGFAVAESVNKPGLRRSKKSVAIGRLKRAYEMEDVHFCEFPWNSNDSFGLFCVFDGHSGKECALAARRLIPEYLSRHLEGVNLNVGDDGQVGSAHSLKEVFEAVFLEVDQELCDYEYEGTTCTVVFLWRNSEGRRFVQAANVGDSTALLIRNEVAIPLTEKHHLNVDSEFNRVRMSGVNIHQGQTRLNGLAVSRALGDHFPKSVQCGIIALPSVSPVFELSDVDSFLILATDGLWDVICHQRSYEIIKNETSPKEMSELLLVTALNSVDCTDNVTTVVVKL